MMRSRPPTSRQNTSKVSSNSSFNSSIISTSNPYPKCDFKKQHAKQSLNLICLSSTCKNRGPICVQCKASEHSNHLTMPTKSFMQKVKSKISAQQTKKMVKKEQVGEGKTEEQPVDNKKKTEEILSSIETSKIEMLSILNITIKEIASKIQQIEQQILNEASRLSGQVEEAVETEENISKIVQEFLDCPPEETDLFKMKIKSLLSVVTAKSKQNIEIGSSYEEKVQNFIQKNQNFQNNMTQWLHETRTALNNVFKANQNAKKAETNKIHKFSPQLKIKSIVLTNQNKVAKQTDTKQPGFALINTSPIKQKTVSFKIVNLATNIKVGFCLKDIMKTKGYKMNPAAVGHGSYMIASNLYTFSHTDAGFNMTMKGFNFQTGDIIEVTYSNGQLKFAKKNDTAKFTLPVKKMSEAEQKQLAYCIWLGGNGDKVELV